MSKLKDIFEANLLKSIYFNIKSLPFTQAIRFPFLIYSNVRIRSVGKIVFQTPIHPGMAKLGKVRLGTQDASSNKTIWNNSGTIEVWGSFNIGSGTKIGVTKNAVLVLGEHFNVTGASEIICDKRIVFGNNCLLSWDILIMDTDFHSIYNTEGILQNPSNPIQIGDNVWIGCRASILKGVTVANNSVIAANSTIRKDCPVSYSIYGDGSKIVKQNIIWKK